MRSAHIIAWFACAAHAQAQLFTAQGVGLTVEGGAQLTVLGDVLAQGGAVVENAGTIDLTGDIINNSGGGLFTAVPGTVIMNGTAQMAGGTGVTAFDNLDLQCASLTLQQDVLVGGTYPLPSGVLALNDAIVQLNAKRVVVNNTSSAAITTLNGQLVSESDPLTGYGEVEWRIGSSTGVYVVPFGTGIVDLPVTVDLTAGGTGPGSLVFATYPTDPFAAPNNRPLPAGLSALTNMGGGENAPRVLDRFWPIGASGYTTLPTAALTFTYRDNEWNTGTNTILEPALQAQRFNGAQWSFPPSGSVNTSANSVTTASTGAFDMVWALVESSMPLPVELLSFSGERVNEREVMLHWSTASERNNEGFEVWRMIEGEDDFTRIGWVEGAGDSQTLLSYGFPDMNSASRTSYYKLKQVDINGQSEWSPMVAVAGTDARTTMVLYPNPAHAEFFILGDKSAWGSVTLLDAAGRAVREWPVGAHYGVDALPGGVYFVRVGTTDGGTRQERLVVE